MGTKETKTGIHAKLLAIQQELPSAPKNGYNSFHRYKYVTEADVLGLINPLCVKQRVTHYINQQEAYIERDSATVKVELVLTDTESGEDLRASSWGYAQDSRGDKAVYKAITGATKYAYLKFFGLSVGDDPENESSPATAAATDTRDRGGYAPRKPEAAAKPDAAAEARDFARQALLQKIGELFYDHHLTRADFGDVPAIQTPEKASLEALEEALVAVQNHAAKLPGTESRHKSKTITPA